MKTQIQAAFLLLSPISLTAKPLSGHELIITLGPLNTYSPGNDQANCHPGNLFLQTQRNNGELITDRIYTRSGYDDPEEEGSEHNRTGVGAASFTVTDSRLGTTNVRNLNCSLYSNPDLTFAGYKLKHDPRVKLTKTCDDAMKKHDSAQGGAYERAGEAWRHAHEICREFQTQLVEHLWGNELWPAPAKAVRVEVVDGEIVLPYQPKDRTPKP